MTASVPESKQPSAASRPRRHWVRLGLRVGRLLLRQPQRTGDLVRQSYDRIASGYDHAWTDHMRHLTVEMLDRLDPPAGAECIDLACGTGFATGELARRTGREALGVDASAGMLDQARRQRATCRFVQDDVLAFLRRRPARSADVVTCCWALGYSRPWSVVRQIARVLRPGGRVGIIDNTLLSLSGVMSASLAAFAERPDLLHHAMRVRFLPNSTVLALQLRLAGLGVGAAWDGAKTYHVPDGASAIARLRETGAAAGFEFAAGADARDEIFSRFAAILDERYPGADGDARPDGDGDSGGPDAAGRVPVTHRYLAAVGHKR